MTNDLTADYLRKILLYDPKTGAWVWRARMGARGKVGDIAGSLNGKGYRQIGILGRSYRSNRLAFLYMNGEWPEGEVDHDNLDKSDDRWENLRPASRSKNQANVPLQINNTSGVKGVSWHKPTKKWQSRIMSGRVTKYIGLFDCRAAAHFAYIIEADKLFGDFARAA